MDQAVGLGTLALTGETVAGFHGGFWTVTTSVFCLYLFYIAPWFRYLYVSFIVLIFPSPLQDRNSYFWMHPPSIVPLGTYTLVSVVIGSTLGKSSASKPCCPISKAWLSLFTPVFHLNALFLLASSKMLFAFAKNFLPLLGPSVQQIAPWRSREVVAKCLFALTLVFQCLETWQGFLYFSTFLLRFCPTLLEHLLRIIFLFLSTPPSCTFRVPACSEPISHWNLPLDFSCHLWYITLWEKQSSCENKYLHKLDTYANTFNYYFCHICFFYYV